MPIDLKRLNFLILMSAYVLISAALDGIYLKIFKMNPPASTLVLQLPILMLMLGALLFHIRQAVFGAFAAWPYILIVILAVLSYKWSINPGKTLKEDIVMIILVPYLACAAFMFTWQDIVEAGWLVITTLCALGIALFFLVPSLGKMAEIHVGALSGFWIEKNAAGQVGVFGTIFALARLAIRPRTILTSLPSAFICIAVVLLSTSKTSLIALIVAFGIYFWVFAMRRSLPIFIMAVWSSVCLLSPLVYFLFVDRDAILKLLGRSSTFTGRAGIWDAVQTNIAAHPWFGHGYAAFWGDPDKVALQGFKLSDLGYVPTHAHNSWLEMALYLGWVGAGLLAVAVFIALGLALTKVRTTHGAYFAVPFLAAALIIGSFESILAAAGNTGGAIMIIVLAKLVRRTQMSERGRTIYAVQRSFHRRLYRRASLGYVRQSYR